eukprot:m.150329 g.150329  ORF g.150329 m.150329 type:complete len:1464 (+) comp11682_c1_seq1:719-5110(+)
MTRPSTSLGPVILGVWSVVTLLPRTTTASGAQPPIVPSAAISVSTNVTCDPSTNSTTCIGGVCRGCTGHSNVSAVIDGQSSTYWASPPGTVPVVLDLDLGGRKEVQSVVVTYGDVFPEAVVILRTMEATGAVLDTPPRWEPWQYYAQDCVDSFNMVSDGSPATTQSPVCNRITQTAGSGTRSLTFTVLNSLRVPVGADYRTNTALQNFSLARRIRVLLVSYTTSNTEYDVFGSPISINNFPFFIVHEAAARARCRCHGHATACNVSDGACHCLHNTTGAECSRCLPTHNAVAWAAGVIPLPAINDPGRTNACLPCNCSSWAPECAYNASRYNATGDGSDCRAYCQGNRAGYNCEQCRDGYYKVPDAGGSWALDDFLCVPCQCSVNGSTSLVCNHEDGTCPCKANTTGATCDTCQRGHRTLTASNPDGCVACDCYAPGTRGDPLECDQVRGCDCDTNYTGWSCHDCVDDFFRLVDPSPADPASPYTCQACHPQCADGCTGQRNVDCITCRHDQLVVNASVQCVASCSALRQSDPDRYFVRANDTTVCGLCDGSCAGGCTDVGPRACMQCVGVRYNGTCIDQCPPRTFPSTITTITTNGTSINTTECLACHSECRDGCDGPTAADCVGCNALVAVNGTCVTSCDDGEYIDPTGNDAGGSAPQCRTCDVLCNGCNGAGPTNCTACRAGARLSYVGVPVPTCVTACRAQDAYNGTDTNGALACLACNDQCAGGCSGPGPDECSVDAGCANWVANGVCVASCPAPLVSLNATMTCNASCPHGMYADSNRFCNACDDNCMRCNGPGECDVCEQGWVLARTGPDVCVSACGTDEFVQETNTTLVGDTVVTTVRRCALCDSECVAGCRGPSATQCQACRNVELNGTCLAACPPLMYTATGGRCEPCSTECAVGCQGPLPTQCTPRNASTLPQGHGCVNVVENGECVTTCSRGWYTTGPNVTVCSACHPTCRSCNAPGANGCTACSTSRFLHTNGSCGLCDSACGGTGACSGTGPTACTDGCRQLTALDDPTPGSVRCVSQCPPDWATVNGTTCVRCDAQCRGGCTDAGADACVACANVNHVGECVAQCPAGWVARAVDGVCEQCHPACDGGCTGPAPTECTRCLFALHNGACVTQCPNQTYLAFTSSGRECMTCHPECGIDGCVGPQASDCRSCAVARLGNMCVNACPDRTFLDGSTGSCRSCHDQCTDDGCTGPSAFDCMACRSVQHNGLCATTCPTGFYADAVTSVCQRCDAQCVDCSGPGPTQCGTCANAVDLGSPTGRQCVAACSRSRFVTLQPPTPTCMAACPDDEPFYADVRITRQAAQCASNCTALNMSRLTTISPADPMLCTTPALAASDRDATSESTIPTGAIVVAIIIALAVLMVVVLIVLRRRNTARRGGADLNDEAINAPPPVSTELAKARAHPVAFNASFSVMSSPGSRDNNDSRYTSTYLDVVPTDVDEQGTATTKL